MDLVELRAYLVELRDRGAEAAIPAADGMADAFRDEVKARLTAKSHARPTRTPSLPGEPPAAESGELADTVTTDPATTPVVATAKVGPHASPKDWVQEYGKTIRAKTPYGMRFQYGDDHYKAFKVKVPERSYMRSTLEILVADGSLTRAAAEAFYAAVWGVPL